MTNIIYGKKSYGIKNELYGFDKINILDFNGKDNLYKNESEFLYFNKNIKTTNKFNYFGKTKNNVVIENIQKHLYKLLLGVLSSTYLNDTNHNINSISLEDDTSYSQYDGIELKKLMLIGINNQYVLFNSNALFNLTRTSEYLGGTRLRELARQLYSLTNGVYEISVIQTNIIVDANGYLTLGTADPKLLKYTTIIKGHEDWNDINEDFVYINNQINNPTFIEVYNDIGDTLKTAINTVSPNRIDKYTIIKDYILQENWEWIKPNLYQVYNFKSDYSLKKIEFYLETPPTNNLKYSGKIAVYYGFLINGNLSKSGILDTFIIDIDANSNHNIENGKVTLDLIEKGYAPIYIPKNTEFFIGFLKENPISEDSPNCFFEYIENGGYDVNSDTLISYPANFDSKIVLNETEYRNIMLKIDLTVSKYKLIEEFLLTGSYETLSGQEFIRFISFTKNIIPEKTFLTYYYSLNTSEPTWIPFNLNDDITFPISNSSIIFKVVLKTENQFVSPIIKNYNIVNFKNMPIDENSFATYSWYKSNYKGFSWKNLNDNEKIIANPLDIDINTLTFKNIKSQNQEGDVLLENRYVTSIVNGTEIKIPITVEYFKPYSDYEDVAPYVVVYRVVIDYINPLYKYNEIFPNSKDYGIPILLLTENNKHIKPFQSQASAISKYYRRLVLTESPNPEGMMWINDENYDVSNYYKNSGTNYGWGVGNPYGKKLIITKTGELEYKQIFEFVGREYKKYNNIKMKLLLPFYRNSDNKYIYTTIKNITFTCDVLTKYAPSNYFVRHEPYEFKTIYIQQ